MGKLKAICISEKKGERKTPLQTIRLLKDHGLQGDAHAGDWHRQVSLLAAANIETIRNKGLPNLKAGDFAENLILSGVDMSRLGLGSELRIGSSARLSITQIGKVCHARCAIFQQTGDCIMPRLGLFARVLQDGEITVNDPVRILSEVSRITYQVVLLTVSDRCSRGEATDTAGPAVGRLLEQHLDCHIYGSEIIPDEREQIAKRLQHYASGHSIDLVLAVGGTGFSPRDVTPEAVSDVVDRPTPGLDEAMRQASLAKTPRAMLSRATSGISGSTLIISLPGSEKAATENLAAVLPALDHGLSKLRGDASDCGREEKKDSG